MNLYDCLNTESNVIDLKDQIDFKFVEKRLIPSCLLKKDKILKVRDLIIKLNNKTLTRPFSFDCSFGDMIGIVGNNGTGKSRLIYTLTGLYNDTCEGFMDWSPFVGPGSLEVISFGNFPTIFEKVTVLSFLKEDLKYRSVPFEKEVLDFACNLLEIPVKDLESNIGTLSVGTKNKVFLLPWIFLTLSKSDSLISCLDEIGVNIDIRILNKLILYMKKITEISNQTIFLVSHDKNLIKYCNKLIVFDKSRANSLTDVSLVSIKKSLERFTLFYSDLFSLENLGITVSEQILSIKKQLMKGLKVKDIQDPGFYFSFSVSTGKIFCWIDKKSPHYLSSYSFLKSINYLNQVPFEAPIWAELVIQKYNVQGPEEVVLLPSEIEEYQLEVEKRRAFTNKKKATNQFLSSE